MDTAYYIKQITRYIRLFIVVSLLIGIIIMGDYWLRGELGKVGGFLKSVKERLGIEVLILGGMLYLLLLSIAQTCRFQNKSFLKFLLSKERDIDTFRSPKRVQISRPISPMGAVDVPDQK